MDRLKKALCRALHERLEGRGAALPPGAAILWNAFTDLSGARGWHAHGPNPISYDAIGAYCHLMNLPLQPRHIAVLRAMDDQWLQFVSDHTKKPPGASVAQPVGAMSPAMFDAVFGSAG